MPAIAAPPCANVFGTASLQCFYKTRCLFNRATFQPSKSTFCTAWTRPIVRSLSSTRTRGSRPPAAHSSRPHNNACHSLPLTVNDVKWVPSSARFVMVPPPCYFFSSCVDEVDQVGSYPKNTGALHMYQVNCRVPSFQLNCCVLSFQVNCCVSSSFLFVPACARRAEDLGRNRKTARIQVLHLWRQQVTTSDSV